MPTMHRTLSFLFGASLVLLTGCNGLTQAAPPNNIASAPQTYMSPLIAVDSASSAPFYLSTESLTAYTVDDTRKTFSQITASLTSTQQGAQVDNAGTFTMLDRNLLSLSSTYAASFAGNAPGTPLNPPVTGSYLFELPGQAGGLVQLQNQAATPVVATTSCPDLTKGQTYEYIIFPSVFWDAANQTAFGSVNIKGSGGSYQLSNIQQFTLPLSGGTPGTPSQAFATTASGACSSTPYGNALSVPASLTITDPGGSSTVSPQAILGIGPSGFLVQSFYSLSSATNLLGPAVPGNKQQPSTGVVGIPEPSSPVDTGSLLSHHYLGAVFGAGVNLSGTASGWSSTIASFGFPTLPANCASLAPASPTLLYGGDFPANNPGSASVQAGGGYGNCDFALDLGAQSTGTNGLYPSATVWIGKNFSANPQNATYSFPAVVIAGQVQGSFVILAIAKDSTQPWALYLFQAD